MSTEREDYWTKKAEAILLNGTLVYPSKDDEGNDAGALFYQSADKENDDYVLPVITE